MKTINTIILSGGGVLGLCYCGVFKKLHELDRGNIIKLNIKRISCNSVGAVFGFLYNLGYNSDNLEEEILLKNFIELKDSNISNFFTKYGIDTGKNLITWLETMILKKGMYKHITFIDLYKKSGIWLQIITTNMSTYSLGIFDYINTPDVPITTAVRFSISLPFIFTYEKLDNKDIYVDGALMCNYPINLIADSDLSTTIGVRLNNSDLIDFGSTELSFYDYITKIFTCLKREHDLNIINKYKEYTIFINPSSINDMSLVNFNIKKRDKLKLIQLGYKATTEYFQTM